MNRLILLGNGLDLAHGMKTSYNDFILWHLENCFEHAIKNLKYEDELLTIVVQTPNLAINELGGKSIKEYLYKHYSDQTLGELMGIYSSDITLGFITSDDSYDSYYESLQVPFKFEIKSTLFKQLILNCSYTSWVQIENLFYSVLKKALDDKNQNKQKDVLELNKALEYIILQLQIYFSTLDSPGEIQKYNLLLKEQINRDELIIKRVVRTTANPGTKPRTLVLNFNYTPTIEQYISNNSNVEVNYIHGKLNDESNPVIFGFGDELDAEYAKFELDTNTRGIFRYIKSFWYFKTSNYHNLLRFIQSDKFQVHILGHSCGLSDRTMLNMIFEHENCASIKIHFYEFPDGSGNNFTELTEEISRHFKNKQQMRLKIVPFDKSQPMPQL